MASGTISTRPQEEGVLVQGRYDDFIEKRLAHTRRQVRLVDVGSGMVLLAAASLFFFLVVAVADHWLFPHGLNFFFRLVLWVVWVAVAGWFAWRSVAPSIMHRINPVFAAQAIEHDRPTLKNSLINFFLLRSHPDDVAPVVYRAMEHRAAADLLRVPVEQAVDHRRLVHLCYVLAGAVVLFALYLAFSPKNPLVSAARVIWPWSTLPAPTRVHIEDVQPGSAVAFQGDRQQISAHVSGLRSGEEVSLLMSTADGQLTDDRVPMARTGDDDRYACELPPGTGGMQQDTLYRITAGDASTPQLKLEVQIAPMIDVDQVDYDYPPYTELPHRTIKGQGDIKALEGTKVTIHAAANLPIEKAAIDLGCAGLQTMAMKYSGTQASGGFTLALDPGQNWKPLYDRYQILFKSSAGTYSRHEVQYHIDVDRDYPPEIKIDEPKDETAAVGANGQLRIRVRASDDFGLRRVALRAECSGRPLDLGVLLDRLAPERAFTKPYDGDYDFRPAALGLHKGDEVKYWAEADDNKEPHPNHAETARRTIRIVDDQEARQAQQNQEQKNGGQAQSGDKPQQGNNGKGKGGQDENGRGESSGDGTSTGQPSSDNKGGRDNQQNKPQDSQGGNNDPNKSEKGQRGKDGTSSDPNNGGRGEPDSSENSGQDKRPLDPKTQSADVIKRSLNDLEKQKQQEQNKQGKAGDNSPSGQPQEQQPQESGTKNSQPQDGGTQTSQPQNNNNNGAQGNPQQGNNGNNEPNSGQGNQKQQDASTAQNQPGNNSGDRQSQGKQGDSATNNAPGQQPNSPAKDSSAQGTQKASPQPGNNSQQPNGASPQGAQNQKPGDQSKDAQSTPQNAGSQGKGQQKAAPGSDKSGTNSGGENKPNANQGIKQGQESQASSGPQSAKEKAPGGQPGGSQAGGTQNNAMKKPSGSEGGNNNSQLTANGAQAQKKDNSPGGNSASQPLPAGSKQGNQPKTESTNGSGGSQSSQSKQENKEQSGGAGSGGDKQPKPGQGEQPTSGGGGKQSSAGDKGGDRGNMANGEPHQMEKGKTGEPTRDSSGAPDSQVDPQRSGDKAGNAQQGLNPSDKSQSPGNSPHKSDSTGEAKGDRKGGGGEGGGQPDKHTGKGSAGSSSAAESGGSASNEKGGDAPGKKAGEGLRATDKTGSQHKESGSGGGEKAQPSEKPTSDNSQKSQNNTAQNAGASQQKSGTGQPGTASQQPTNQGGSAFPAGGSRAGDQPPPPPAEEASQPKADEPDLENSDKQVDMALRHIKDEMSKPKSELMDRIGWTPEEAKKFVENIEKLRDSAKQPGNEANKTAYNEFLKDLGLRPHGTRIDSGKAGRDDLSHVRDAVQLEPPAEWDAVSRQYSRKTAEGQK